MTLPPPPASCKDTGPNRESEGGNPQPPRVERRKCRRDGPAPTPPHSAEAEEQTEHLEGFAPHLAEEEPLVEAEVVTVCSAKGKTTIVVERHPGQAAHATVVSEKSSDGEENYPTGDHPADSAPRPSKEEREPRESWDIPAHQAACPPDEQASGTSRPCETDDPNQPQPTPGLRHKPERGDTDSSKR